ncbi:UNVERIFIED_CONTAM: hypothetical protein Slati_1023000 [Sesamum latifolium]|uniref:RNase H type-1 domain-containing protein n=1 Tax=Sesamum latifolium TaxID=2727402 RepID=A0AAW2XRV5_9LAMI
MVWHYSSNGTFSGRSAYHLALSRASSAGSSSMSTRSKVWRAIWQARVPNKTKVFSWRAIRNILPTAQNLQRRVALSNFRWFVIAAQFSSVEDWLSHLSAQLSATDFDLALMICWSIWWSRNLKSVGKDFLYPQQVIDFARSYLSAYNSYSSVPAHSPLGIQSVWLPPPPNCVKLNFDGAVLEEGRAIGVGVAARNSAGNLLAWRSLRLAQGGSALVAEAYAAREALKFAWHHRWPLVLIEGDCVSLLHRISAAHMDYSVVGPLVSDIKALVHKFESVSFLYVRRSGNCVADFLARLALNLDGDVASLPPGLHNVLIGDLAK